MEISKKNNLMIISLWATWCVPCKNELDAVAEVYDDWISETNVMYFAVSIDDSRTSKRIKPMVNGKEWNFEILLDENSDLKKIYLSSQQLQCRMVAPILTQEQYLVKQFPNPN